MDVFQNLRAFLAVAETGSFSAAARRAGLAVSVLTKRIDQLERGVKTKLFVRTTRTVTLTEDGRRWIERVRLLVADFDDTMRQVSDTEHDLAGPIRIKAPTTLTVLYLADILTRFQMLNPKVGMEIVLADRAVNPVDEGFDVAINAFDATFSNVVDIPLYPLRRMLCAAPDYIARRGAPEHPRDLLAHDTLSFAPTGSIWSFNGPQGATTVEVVPRMSANDGQVLLRAALAGNGIALLSEYLTAPRLASGELVRVLTHYETPELWVKVLVPEVRIQVARIGALAEFLKQAFTPLPPWSTTAS